MSDSATLDSPSGTLKALSEGLTALESTLRPLLDRPLQDTIAQLERGSSTASRPGNEESSGNGLEGRLDAAKLYTAAAYVLLDLVWMQLKVGGQDVAAHPVTAELERVKGYFAKIKFVQSGQTQASSSTHRTGVTLPGQEGRARLDQGAAGRFVKNALAASEKGTHTKFEDSESSGSSDGKEETRQKQGGGTIAKHDKSTGRIVKDPFEGYDSPRANANASASPASLKKRKASSGATAGADAETGTGSPASHSKESKKSKKKRK
ncbi:unnamed protein product [Parajaminaea phylloscopi]